MKINYLKQLLITTALTSITFSTINTTFADNVQISNTAPQNASNTALTTNGNTMGGEDTLIFDSNEPTTFTIDGLSAISDVGFTFNLTNNSTSPLNLEVLTNNNTLQEYQHDSNNGILNINLNIPTEGTMNFNANQNSYVIINNISATSDTKLNIGSPGTNYEIIFKPLDTAINANNISIASLDTHNTSSTRSRIGDKSNVLLDARLAPITFGNINVLSDLDGRIYAIGKQNITLGNIGSVTQRIEEFDSINANIIFNGDVNTQKFNTTNSNITLNNNSNIYRASFNGTNLISNGTTKISYLTIDRSKLDYNTSSIVNNDNGTTEINYLAIDRSKLDYNTSSIVNNDNAVLSINKLRIDWGDLDISSGRGQTVSVNDYANFETGYLIINNDSLINGNAIKYWSHTPLINNGAASIYYTEGKDPEYSFTIDGSKIQGSVDSKILLTNVNPNENINTIKTISRPGTILSLHIDENRNLLFSHNIKHIIDDKHIKNNYQGQLKHLMSNISDRSVEEGVSTLHSDNMTQILRSPTNNSNHSTLKYWDDVYQSPSYTTSAANAAPPDHTISIKNHSKAINQYLSNKNLAGVSASHDFQNKISMWVEALGSRTTQTAGDNNSGQSLNYYTKGVVGAIEVNPHDNLVLGSAIGVLNSSNMENSTLALTSDMNSFTYGLYGSNITANNIVINSSCMITNTDIENYDSQNSTIYKSKVMSFSSSIMGGYKIQKKHFSITPLIGTQFLSYTNPEMTTALGNATATAVNVKTLDMIIGTSIAGNSNLRLVPEIHSFINMNSNSNSNRNIIMGENSFIYNDYYNPNGTFNIGGSLTTQSNNFELRTGIDGNFASNYQNILGYIRFKVQL